MALESCAVLRYCVPHSHPVSGLSYHAWDESGNDPAGEVYWGRGNGWALLADVAALSAITTTHPFRSTILDIMQKRVEGLKPLQDASGLWHTVLTQPDSYLETSVSGPTWPMLTEEEFNGRPHDSFQLYGQGVALLLESPSSKLSIASHQ